MLHSVSKYITYWLLLLLLLLSPSHCAVNQYWTVTDRRFQNLRSKISAATEAMHWLNFAFVFYFRCSVNKYYIHVSQVYVENMHVLVALNSDLYYFVTPTFSLDNKHLRWPTCAQDFVERECVWLRCVTYIFVFVFQVAKWTEYRSAFRMFLGNRYINYFSFLKLGVTSDEVSLYTTADW